MANRNNTTKQLPSPDYLRERLDYDPRTGALIWKLKAGNSKGDKVFNTLYSGNRAGSISTRYHHKDYLPIIYREIRLDKVLYLEHRIIWAVYYGASMFGHIDHIDGNGENNRIANLRETNQKENLKNKRMSSKNTSGRTGVSYHKLTGKWRASMQVNERYIYLGLFSSFEDAVTARRIAEIKYGFHPNHGLTQAERHGTTVRIEL